jgi:hypothetical protein
MDAVSLVYDICLLWLAVADFACIETMLHMQIFQQPEAHHRKHCHFKITLEAAFIISEHRNNVLNGRYQEKGGCWRTRDREVELKALRTCS